jgi:hypothetical protein
MYLAAAADFNQFSEILVSVANALGTLNELMKEMRTISKKSIEIVGSLVVRQLQLLAHDVTRPLVPNTWGKLVQPWRDATPACLA